MFVRISHCQLLVKYTLRRMKTTKIGLLQDNKLRGICKDFTTREKSNIYVPNGHHIWLAIFGPNDGCLMVTIYVGQELDLFGWYMGHI